MVAAASQPLDTPRFAPTPEGDGTLPLSIVPGSGARSVDALVGWLGSEKTRVQSKLREHGALLIRGFEIGDPRAFERVARAIAPDLKNDYLGTSPRDALTEYVFSASELPPYYPIPQHCEMSFLASPPARLFFSCLVAPSGPGGETPLVDFRRVYRDLDPAVRARFEERGVRIIRNYAGPSGGGRFDLWKLKRWDEMFGTTDRAAVERICREQRFDFTWRSGDRLTLTSAQPAVRKHPETGEPAWFNHAQVFHLSAAPGEYARIVRRQPELRLAALALLSAGLVFLKRRFVAVEDQALHATFGDGSEIPDGDMERVRDAIWKNMVLVRWRAGDVVAIDNFAVAHGRMPYRGARQVVVCWA